MGQSAVPQVAPGSTTPMQATTPSAPGMPLPAGVTRVDQPGSPATPMSSGVPATPAAAFDPAVPGSVAPAAQSLAASGVPVSAFAPQAVPAPAAAPTFVSLDPITGLPADGAADAAAATGQPGGGVAAADLWTGQDTNVDADLVARLPFSDEVRQAAARSIGDTSATDASTAQDGLAVEGSASEDDSAPPAPASAAADGDETSAQSRGDGRGEQNSDRRGDQRSDTAPSTRDSARTDFVPFGGERGFNAAASMPVGAAAAAPGGAAPAAAPLQAQILAGLDPILRRGDGLHQIELQLAPAHLGKVRITLELRGGEVSVMMHAADGAARDLLKSNVDDLRSQLTQMGLSAGSVDVDSGGHADGDDGWQQLADNQAQARRDAERGDGTGFPDASTDDATGDYGAALTRDNAARAAASASVISASAAPAPADRTNSPTTPAPDSADGLDRRL